MTKHRTSLVANAVVLVLVAVSCGSSDPTTTTRADRPATTTTRASATTTTEPALTTTDPATTTTEPPTTTTEPPTTTTTLPEPVGQFAGWVGGGDPAPCDDGIWDFPPPPYFGPGFGAESATLGGRVYFCVLGFAIKSPVVVTVQMPDGTVTAFEVWVGTNTASDVLSDPLRGAIMNTPHDAISWVISSEYAPGTYVFTAVQGDRTSSSSVDFHPGASPRVEALDREVAFGETVRFALSGLPPGEFAALAMYRDTEVRDPDPSCDLCNIFGLHKALDPIRADANGGAVFSVVIDESYAPPPGPQGSASSGDYCLVTPGAFPACEAFGYGWFRAGGIPAG